MQSSLWIKAILMGKDVGVNVHFSQHFAERLPESYLVWQSLDPAEDRCTFEKGKLTQRGTSFSMNRNP